MTDPIDYDELDRQMDRVKSRVFIGNNAAFLGSLLCRLNFSWTTDIPTAATNGIMLIWNPHWFMQIPFKTRLTVLVHELWHVALLHMIRRGTRHPRIWNYACDLHINNGLEDDGFSFEGTNPWLDQSFGDNSSEENYDILMKEYEEAMSKLKGQGAWSLDIDETGDIVDIPDPAKQAQAEQEVINAVVGAANAAALAGGAGDIPGEVELILKRFLAPKVPWASLLHRFFNDMFEKDFRWTRPNRRYPDMYLPSLAGDNGLEHLVYYLDVSGSISQAQIIRFNSEVKYIKDTFNPLKLTLVLFDTKIQREIVFDQEDRFDEIVVVGRGGTSLVDVREDIIKKKPTCAIIFSDLDCTPMQPLPFEIPVIWIAINTSKTGPFGKTIHIQE